MTWDPNRTNTRSSLPIGTCPTGTAVGTKLTGTIRVCAIGDSFTADITNSPNFQGWIYMFDLMAQASGLTLSWVGNLSTGTPAYSHRAAPGTLLTQHMSGGANDDIAYLTSLAVGARPQVVFLYFSGVNEHGAGGTEVSAYGTHMATFQGQLKALIPDVRVIMCRGSKLNGVSNETDGISMRAQVSSSYATLAGGGELVTLADTNMLTGDIGAVGGHHEPIGSWTHPNYPGHMFVAHQLWAPFLNATGRSAVWPGDPAG